ncbi:MAG: ShlB/FhaC/HecB family hemolysin secretion/activation protein [Halomonadaceae bacterium]|jgi:hemolysin activation/secretion protein
MSLLTVAGLLLSAPLAAQTLPDAGRVLQEMVPVPQPTSSGADFDIVPAPLETTQPGGATVVISEVRFSGNTRFDDAVLRGLIEDSLGEPMDLAALRDLANRISLHYRSHGYTFARAYIPPQELNAGRLEIAVLEGRYGEVSASSETASELAVRAEPFLGALSAGEVIEASKLERTVLLLGDLPGVAVSPLLRPGEEVGTGDLEVRVAQEPKLNGAISADNHGNRYSGSHRGQVKLQLNSPFMLGDRVTLNSVLSDEELWLGKVGYELPLGISGLRGELSYSQTRYQLGDEFAVLDYRGVAKLTSAGVSYPLLRSQRSNVRLTASYQHKELSDDFRAVEVRQEKSSDSLPVGIQFDRRDGLLGGGITYGAVNLVNGRLSLGTDEQREADRLSARTEGSYTLMTLDMARLQRLDDRFTLYGRFAGQLADSNLDSSEGFVLGGANGVRAYPQGEAFGDQGWLAQLEMRYRYQALEPYLFYDTGRTSINHNPWFEGDNTRSLSGGGVGTRLYYGAFSADASLAWANVGGEPQSDTRDRTPRLWLQAEYRF